MCMCTYIYVYIYCTYIYIYMCVCLCACVQCYTYIIFYTYRGSRKDGIWTAQDKMAYRANVIFWWHLNRWVFQNVPSYIACLTQSIGVCIKEQFKGTQVCHLSVEKHIGQQQPAASFSHLSIGFGGLRWHIKTPQKIAVQNNLSHIGTDSFIFLHFAMPVLECWQRTLRWHIQAHPVRERWKLLQYYLFHIGNIIIYMDHVWNSRSS